MRIEAEITGIKQTGQRLASASQNLSQLRDSLRRAMGGLTMESRRRPEIDSQYQQIDRWLWELAQEMETLSRYTTRKAEQFADDDNHSLQLKTGTGWSWKKSLGNVLDFLPVIGNIEGLIEALRGRDSETGGKLEGWERLLYGIGPLGKGVLQGAKLLGAADELAEGIQFVGRATEEAGAKLQSVGKATLEGLQEGVEVGWDFIQGAKSAIQEDMSLGLLKDPEREYEHPIAEKVGELTGHTVGTVLGGLEMLTGLGGETGSLIFDATGVGTLVGVPGMAASAVLAGYGLTSATKGAAGMGSSARDLVQMVKGEGTSKLPSNFADRAKLESHFDKHGDEFGGIYKDADEYLDGAKAVINDGIEVQYEYKGETRTGYVKFMGNNKDGNAKFEFVGTNNNGEITTYHTQSGKKFWKTINGENVPVINPAE